MLHLKQYVFGKDILRVSFLVAFDASFTDYTKDILPNKHYICSIKEFEKTYPKNYENPGETEPYSNTHDVDQVSVQDDVEHKIHRFIPLLCEKT